MSSCQPAAAGDARGGGFTAALMGRIVGYLHGLLHVRRSVARSRGELRAMSEHMLRDLGLGRDGAERAWFD